MNNRIVRQITVFIFTIALTHSYAATPNALTELSSCIEKTIIDSKISGLTEKIKIIDETLVSEDQSIAKSKKSAENATQEQKTELLKMAEALSAHVANIRASRDQLSSVRSTYVEMEKKNSEVCKNPDRFKETLSRVKRKFQQRGASTEAEKDIEYFFDLKDPSVSVSTLAKAALDSNHNATLSLLIDMGFDPTASKVGEMSFISYAIKKKGADFSKDLSNRFETAPIISDIFPSSRKTISIKCEVIKSKLEAPDLMTSFEARPYFINGHIMAFQIGKVLPQSIPDRLGLQSSDIVLEANKISIMSVADGLELYKKSKESDLHGSYIKFVRNRKRTRLNINCVR
jgi:hypothetical protein